MDTSRSGDVESIAVYRRRLEEARYNAKSIRVQVAAVTRFLAELRARGLSLEHVDEAYVAAYWRRRRLTYERERGAAAVPRTQWARAARAAVRGYLRARLGSIPVPPPPPGSPAERAAALVEAYRAHLCATRHLGADTLTGVVREASHFLDWCASRALVTANGVLCSAGDVDAYQRARAVQLRRTTLSLVTRRLRALLAFLYASGRLRSDLATRVIAPTLYQYEGLPAVLTDGQIKAVLSMTRRDRSAKGRRDYAMLTLLATYGIRSSELVGLRLADIDWRSETITITQGKTYDTIVVPLLPHVAAAFLAYLRHGRPRTPARELFLRMRPPHRGLARRASVYGVVTTRLRAAGIVLTGKRGPHLFRHARAVSLLRARVPVKAIADILGHRSLRSTATYLKLQDEDLRGVALPVPAIEEVSHGPLA